MTTTTCTVTTTATGGKCGAPAVLTFAGGELGECETHAIRVSTPEPVKPKGRAAYCRREACVDVAGGPEYVAHAPH